MVDTCFTSAPLGRHHAMLVASIPMPLAAQSFDADAAFLEKSRSPVGAAEAIGLVNAYRIR